MRVGGEDLVLERLQLRPRVQAELLAQKLAGLAVGGQGVALPAAPVEREHELPAQPLPERELRDQAGQLSGEVGVAAGGQVSVGLVLQHRQPLFFQPGRLRAQPRARLRALAQGRSPPQVQRLRGGHRRRRRRPRQWTSCRPFRASAANDCASSSPSASASMYPGGAVTTRDEVRSGSSSASRRRRRCTWTCRFFSRCREASSCQSASMSALTGTT